MRRLAALLLLVLLVGCATRTVSPEKLSAIRTVGVISAVGQEFRVQTVGFTVFGNDLKTMPFDSWGLDEFLVEQVSAALRPRFDVKPVTYRKEAFSPGRFYLPGGQSIFGETTRRPVGDVIREASNPGGLDAYVLILPASSLFGATNQVVEGIGTVRGAGRNYLHTLYYIALLDGRDFQVIGTAAPPRSSAGFLMIPMLRGPYRKSPVSLAAATISPLEGETLNAALRPMFEETLPATLRDLKLID